jgi:hypothetical protein
METLNDFRLKCDHYDYELKLCKSFKIKIFDYLTGDEVSKIDCEKFAHLFNECIQNETSNLKLNNYENDFFAKRYKSVQENNVWEYRSTSPKDWNAALPDWCIQNMKNTTWYNQSQSEK